MLVEPFVVGYHSERDGERKRERAATICESETSETESVFILAIWVNKKP